MAIPTDDSALIQQPKTELRRMWINQPSTLQPHHALHGINVLALQDYPGTYRVYFLSGNTISQQMSSLCLSEGWPL